MCPEPGLVSAWVDGEVPSPWKERISAHVASCPDCAARVARYRKLSGLLASEGSCDEASVLARLEARLGKRLDVRKAEGGTASPARPAAASGLREAPDVLSVQDPRPYGGPGKGHSWNRSIPLPLPVAIAAAAAFLFFAGVTASTFLRPANPAVRTLAASEIQPQGSQTDNMEALVHYLESQNAQVNLTIQLPTGTTFDSSGKPFVVKATDADYAPLTEIQP